jgi:hypothetical protein
MQKVELKGDCPSIFPLSTQSLIFGPFPRGVSILFSFASHFSAELCINLFSSQIVEGICSFVRYCDFSGRGSDATN